MNKKTINIKRLDVLSLTQSLDYLQGKETKLWLVIDRNLNILVPIVKDLIDFQKKIVEKGDAKITDNQLIFENSDIEKEYTDFVTEDLSLELYELDLIKLEDEKLSPVMMKQILTHLVNDNK